MMKRVAILGSVAVMALTAAGAPAHAQFKSSLDESKATATESARSQQRVEELDDQTTALVNDYRANLKQLEAAQRYNESLRRNISAQERQIGKLQADIENVSGLQRAMQPLMEDMLNGLERLVAADMPFLAGERSDRIDRLKGVMNDPSVSAAQRYRLIVEAYQIENEYGRTIGAYEGTTDFGEGPISGEFLRVGRVALVFKSPDDSTLKAYDKDVGGWVDLPRSFLPDIKLGLRMAKEQTAPDLLPIPVKGPVAAQ